LVHLEKMVWWTNQYKTCFVIIVSKLLHRGEAAVICFTIPSTSSNLVASTNLNLLILQLQLECSPAFHFYPLLVSETSSLLDLHKGEIQHEGWEGGSSPLPIMGDGHHPSFFPNHLSKNNLDAWMKEKKEQYEERDLHLIILLPHPTVIQVTMPLPAVSNDRKWSVGDYSCYLRRSGNHAWHLPCGQQSRCMPHLIFFREHTLVCVSLRDCLT